jgi:hypothetical protein
LTVSNHPVIVNEMGNTEAVQVAESNGHETREASNVDR